MYIILQAFLHHMDQFANLSSGQKDGSFLPLVSINTLHNLRQSGTLLIELARSQHDQIKELQTRLRSQIDVTRTLMAQRDTQIQLDIAYSAKRDSELMRGIATITMIFLPATFVATFFSMVFFDLGENQSVHFVVHRRIWLYPAITLPLTIGIAVWYSSWLLGSLRGAIGHLSCL